MKLIRKIIYVMFKATVFGLVVGIALTATTLAETFPSKQLRIVVPAPAGGGTDGCARRFQDGLMTLLNYDVLVENRAGGGQKTGTIYVGKTAKPDGYTVLITGTTVMSVNPAIYGEKLKYSFERDFEPLGLLYKTPNVFTIHPSVPAKTLAEFVDYVKKNPGKLNYASGGYGSLYHLGTEYFLTAMGGLKMTHIPYKGGHPCLVANLANEVQLSLNSIIPTLPHIKEGNLRALGTTGLTRLTVLPDIPTVEESGYPGFQIWAHVGAFVPKKTPKEHVKILREAFKKVNFSKKVIDFYNKVGATPGKVDREEYIQYHNRDVLVFREAAKKVGLYKGN